MKTFCLSSLLLIFVIGTSKADTFTFVPDGRPLTIYVDEEPPSVVQCALTMFCDDYKYVFGDSPQRVNRDKADIIVECSENGEWEHFDISVSRQGRLHVKGSDPRGTAYGILELSRLIGISPWVWWADVPPQKLSSYTLPAGYHNSQQPSVQYRGIFINDEDYGLNPWSWKTHEPESDKGEIGPRTYERIFQLLLRLRANMLMPAMHDCSVPFYMVEGNKEMAEKYQIVMATSHCEPLMRNNVGEWDDSRRGRYNYISNRDSVLAYWRERLEEVGKSENIYTIGMRGKHDGKMEGCKNTAEMAQIMPRVIEDQRSLLSLYVDSPANQVPQIFVPYKELLDVYNKGIDLPDDVTLMWCDDNYGHITRLSNKEERQRKGGAGIYYHISYWGRPHSYLWLCTTAPAQIYYEMRRAWDYGARKIWALNVGDIKPAEYDIEFFMDMAWNLDKVSSEGVTAHLKHWLERELGTSCAKTILSVMQEHYRLAHIRKPEFMGNTREEEKNPVYRVVKDLPWSEREINERLNAYSELSETVEKAASKVPAGRQSAYFELVKYPVQAATQMNRKLLYAQLARHDKEDWEKSDAAYDSIAALTQHYNSLENGKWNRMMDFKPRKLPVFNRVERKAATAPMTADRKAVCQWNAAEAKKGNAIVCEGLGYESKAAEIKKGDALTFSFGNLKTDSVEVDIRLLPNHPVHGDKLRFTVSLDGAEPEVIAYETKGRSEEWKENVLRNQAIRKIVLPVTGKKSHQLVIKALDEGVILDQVMLYEVNRNSSGI